MSTVIGDTEVFCHCGKRLTQPYALEMGECVSCCLDRMRNRLPKEPAIRIARQPKRKYGTTDPRKIEARREYQRNYQRKYRRRRLTEGATS